MDNEIDKYFLLDSHVKDIEFVTPARTLQMINRDVHHYEESLSNEEEFLASQQRLNITQIGRVQLLSVAMHVDDKTSINLWNREIVCGDYENQKVCKINS